MALEITHLNKTLTIETTEEAEVEIFGSGSHCQILPGLQKLRSICNIAAIFLKEDDNEVKEGKEGNEGKENNEIRLREVVEFNIEDEDEEITETKSFPVELKERKKNDDDDDMDDCDDNDNDHEDDVNNDNDDDDDVNNDNDPDNDDGNEEEKVQEVEVEKVEEEKGKDKVIKEVEEEEVTDFGCDDKIKKDRIIEEVKVKSVNLEVEKAVVAEEEIEVEIRESSGHLSLSNNGSLQFISPSQSRKVLHSSGNVLCQNPSDSLANGIDNLSKKHIPQKIPQIGKTTRGWVVPKKKVILPTISPSVPLGDANLLSSSKAQEIVSVTDLVSVTPIEGERKSYSIYDMKNSKGNCHDSYSNNDNNDDDNNKNIGIVNDSNQMIPQRIISIVKPLHLPRNNTNKNSNHNDATNNHNKNSTNCHLLTIPVETANTLLGKSTKFQVKKIICYFRNCINLPSPYEFMTHCVFQRMFFLVLCLFRSNK